MTSAAGILLAAGLLDLLLGDPRFLPHPVTALARFARALERRLAPGAERRGPRALLLAGAVTTAATLTLAAGGVQLTLVLAARLHPLAVTAVSVWWVYQGLAAHGLVAHALRVLRCLRRDDLAGARRYTGHMVGRDTAHLEAPELVRAVVESLGENFVDGVAAPLFFATLGGPVGIWVYKAASTLDSTLGYRHGIYLYFGRVAARCDDVLNWLPARLSGPVLAAAAALTGLRPRACLAVFLRDRRKHSSPNAAHGEAAVAGALGVRLGGAATYGGMPNHKPHLGEPLEGLAPVHIARACRLVAVASLLALGLAALAARLMYG